MIKDLDNREISCVYYQFKAHLEDLNSRLDSRVRAERVDLGDMTDYSVQPFVILPISDDEVNEIRNSTYYRTVSMIVDKLSHVVEMIEEAEPEIKKSLEE
jgi:hypothetical protein